ncbi:MAG: putative manganese transporter [Paracoccaceae bacterium]
MPLSFAVGVLSGWTIDRINRIEVQPRGPVLRDRPLIGRTRSADWAYLALALPGLAVGAAQLAGVEIAEIFGLPVKRARIAGVFTRPRDLGRLAAPRHDQPGGPVTRMAEETSHLDLGDRRLPRLRLCRHLHRGRCRGAVPVGRLGLPLIAILVGFIPGCGPQVLVATLYINGALPFAALIGNISESDGDALFPAIALNPRAAVMATRSIPRCRR